MNSFPRRFCVALISGTSLAGLAIGTAGADPMPPEKSLSNLEYEPLGRDELLPPPRRAT